MSENQNTAGSPSGLGRCTDCEAVYPVRRRVGGWRAIGTDGSCRCGNTEFIPLHA